MTCPIRKRSMPLPRAPPITRQTPHVVSLWEAGRRHRYQSSSTTASTVTVGKKMRSRVGLDPASKPKAEPELRT